MIYLLTLKRYLLIQVIFLLINLGGRMPRELLQMDQLEKFYSLIANSRVKIGFTSRSDNYMSFKVKESDGSAVKSFSIIYTDDNGGLSAVKNYRDMISLGSYGWVKREDGSYRKQSTDLCSFKLESEGYKLLTDLFHNLKKLDLFAYYDGKEFCNKTFSPFIEALRNLNSQRTTEDASTIDSATAEPSGFKRLEKPTTEGVGHEMQEDSEYVAAALKQQKFDFAQNETTEEIKHVMKEITESNTRNGITTENIMDVTFSSSKVTSENVPAFSELSSTNAALPQLPNESEIAGTTVAGLSTLSICVFGTLGLLGAAMGFGYWLWSRKNREGSYDVEKARGVENKVEAPFSEEQNSLLDEVNIEPGKYKSFQRNINDIL
ncbi:MAG: hypothetical protein PG978_000102 [Wolbachia endosymbiont of Ctenocephalides felis wCfeF]|nr:MAG: hypothetical protein PG978_000102 [Wolbachia endosymbiont of Ctenocephalides felis wCfeF]